MLVAALLGNGVELVEQQYARDGSDIVEQLVQALRGLTQVTADQGVVAHGQEWHRERFSDGLGQRGLAVAGRPRQQDTMAWLQPMGTQQIGTKLLLDECHSLTLGDSG